jgi:pimeloyl-ACP methyl ester carboxylesterase
MKFAQWFAAAAIRVTILVACILAFGTFVILGLCFWLVAANRTFPSRSAPVSGYEEAVSRFNKTQSREQQQVSPLARSILLTHGYRTAKVILFFHGYSSSPPQFRALGEEFFRRGYNVIIPRLPGHGMADRKVTNLSNVQAEELRNCADENVDIAIGLGEKVYVGGLSAGGVLTAWIAENRKEVSRVLLIAPCFALGRKAGTFIQRLGVALLATFPGIALDSYADTPAADYAYPGFSAKAFAQLLRLSIAIFASAVEHPVAVQEVCLVTSKNDQAVSDFATLQLVGIWRFKGLRRLVSIDLPKDTNVGHDMIDPVDGKKETDIVYPIFIGLLEAP